MTRQRFDRTFELVFPELRALPSDERRDALHRASRASFDVIELAGMALAVVAVTWLTRYAAASLGPMERFAWVIANGAIALPLLAAAMAPIAWRRTRRALREACGHRGRARP